MKTHVYVTFDNNFQTWNVVDKDRNCLFYGSAEGCDEWLKENSQTHSEDKVING